jgi:hypothetical protein
MRLPEKQTPPGRVASGEAAVQVGADGSQNAMIGTTYCQCRLNPSGCLACRRWDRTIRGIDARRADSLRRQAIGILARAGD